jgi:radical SAM-linked protein
LEIAQKVELRFRKLKPLRFISHHDLMTTLSRALRRAAVPVRYTEGFNPRPRMVLLQPLPVGVVSEDEVAEIELSEWVRPQELQSRIAAAMPEGLFVTSVRLLRPFRKGQTFAGVEYVARLPLQTAIDGRAIGNLLAASEAFVERRRPDETKRINVRTHVRSLSVEGDSLRMELACVDGGIARPEEVVAVLCGRDPSELRGMEVTKTRTILGAQPVGA